VFKKLKINPRLEPGKSVGPQVYNILRAQILHGDIAPGTAISESLISQNLSVSRQPVREAFIKLRDEGMVEIRPQRGTFVTKISINAVNEARFIREAIEADIVKIVIEKNNPELISKLRTIIQKQKDLSQTQPNEFMDLDDEFHQQLVKLSGISVAWKVISSMKAHFDRVRFLSTTQKPIQRLTNQHEAVVDAIENKDPVKADQAIRYHLREVIRDLPKIVSQHPDFFVDHDSIKTSGQE
jgi:DNA-binding GntR family transcriptional regulator